MADKPKKLSNFTGLQNEEKLKQYITSLDGDVFNIVQYLDRFPRVFEQAGEPTLQRNTFSFWSDSANTKMYLIANISGGQKKVELL